MISLLLNGTINTMDRTDRVVEAMLMANGRILALGNRDEIKSLAPAHTEVIDLQGATAFPGFYDCHNHLILYSYLLSSLDMTPAKVGSIADIVGLVKQATSQAQPGQWVKGFGFIDYALSDHRYPTRQDLDPVSPDHPVVLYHTSFHACVLNSKALEIFNISESTQPLTGGEIEREADGAPSGVLHDANMMLVLNMLFDQDLGGMSPSGKAGMIAAGTARFAQLGLVGAADALVTPTSMTAYMDARQSGALNIRVYTMHEINRADELIKSGLRTGIGDDWLRVGPIKIFADGGMSNRTAAMTEPYLTPPHDQGLVVTDREQLIDHLAVCDQAGFQVAVHAQGDRAISDTLDAYESVLGPKSDNPLRHRIEHGGCMFPHLLKRAAAMNVPVAVQPGMFSILADGWIEAYGQAKADRLYPYRDMLDAGIVLGGSSDCPVIGQDPRPALRDAALRKSPSGAGINQGQAITVDELIRAYTSGSAHMVHNENLAGTLEPGKLADLTIFKTDPRKVPAEEIVEIPITMTIVGGKVAHRI
jgi:predicted amidohydrolase YtcJ